MMWRRIAGKRLRDSLLLTWGILALTQPAQAQPQMGAKTPGFITSTLDGKRVALKDLWDKEGKKIIVLTFFATWCQPCREDLRYLQSIQKRFGDQGLQVVAVLTQDTAKEDRVKKFLGELGVTLPVFTDEYGIIGKRYSIGALPCTFVVDREGVLRTKYLGYSQEVRRLFEEKLKDLF